MKAVFFKADPELQTPNNNPVFFFIDLEHYEEQGEKKAASRNSFERFCMYYYLFIFYFEK